MVNDDCLIYTLSQSMTSRHLRVYQPFGLVAVLFVEPGLHKILTPE
jgi:hypothetical protein